MLISKQNGRCATIAWQYKSWKNNKIVWAIEMRRKGAIVCVYGQKNYKHALDRARKLEFDLCWYMGKVTIIKGKESIKAMAKARGLTCHG